jgi:nitrate/nitrite-specific signal transduction histidine kinase
MDDASHLSPVRRLTLLYVIALSSVALMSLAGQILIQRSLEMQASDSHVVNIAGRQRMLSQRITKAVLALASPQDPIPRATRKKELEKVIALWEQAHTGLRFGDSALRLPGENSVEVMRMFAQIEAPQHAMVAAARRALRADTPDAAATMALLENESAFLEGMDRIVFQYDEEAHARVRRLSRIELALLLATLGVLLLEGFFIFRPAAARLKRVVEDLWDTEDDLRRQKANVERLLAGRPPAESRAPRVAFSDQRQ